MENNLSKRRYRYTLITQQFLKVLIIILNFQNIGSMYKLIFAHVFGIYSIIDYYKFYPIRDNKLNIVYGALVMEFEWITILVSILEISNN